MKQSFEIFMFTKAMTFKWAVQTTTQKSHSIYERHLINTFVFRTRVKKVFILQALSLECNGLGQNCQLHVIKISTFYPLSSSR